MKLGLVSAILDSYSFENMMDTAKNLGFSCVEIACWPNNQAERRYAGVSHIDVNNQSSEYIDYIKKYVKKTAVEISSLAYYPNTMDSNLIKRVANIAHLKKVITMSKLLGVNMVTTFIGRDQYKTVEENLVLFAQIWKPIISFAKQLGVKIAIENCPMLFGAEQWPGGQNLFTSPALWEEIFKIEDSPYLGINYDPSHFVWQQMDYIAPIYTFQEKIFHVHFKDIKLFPDKLAKVGILAYPLYYMSPKLPGLGDVQWGKFVSALTDIKYEGFACIEMEDRAFESTPQRVLDALALSHRYMSQFVI